MNNQKGFSLIEIIITASVFSILALTMSTLILEQRRATTYLEDQLEKIEIIRNVETILKNGLACQQTLLGVTIPSSGLSNVSDLKDNFGSTVYSSNTVHRSLRIGQITVKNDTVPSASSSGFVDIIVPISRVRDGGGPKDFRPIEIKFNVSVDAARIVTNCSTNTSLAGYFNCQCTSWYWKGAVVSPSDMSGQLCYRPNGCSGGCHSGSHTWACSPL